MNKGMLTIGIILLSIIALLLINVLTNYSTGSDLDYYLLKETTDASLTDALDYAYLRHCGLFRIDKEKFVENFLYRFANSIDPSREYTISFYDINEVPPKVSVKINSMTVLKVNSKGKGTGDSFDDNKAADITTSYDAIIESKYAIDPAVQEGLTDPNSQLCKAYYSN